MPNQPRTSTLAALLLAALSLSANSLPPSPLAALLSSVPGVETAVPAPVPPRAPAISGEQLFQQLHAMTEIPRRYTGHSYLDAKKFMFSIGDNFSATKFATVFMLFPSTTTKRSYVPDIR